MAAPDHNFTKYSLITETNEVYPRQPDIRHAAAVRQRSDHIEQFTVDEKREEQNGPQHQPKALDRYMERMNNLWVWELAAIIVALAALSVVIWLLFYLDGTKLRTWTFTVKPNAVLAIFMTIAKSCMLVAIAAGIAQLKWLHYASAPRKIDEFDVFDNAGRGPWGAFRFLHTLSVGHGAARLVASVGALLVVFALAMDPFAQQLLSYEVRFNPQPSLSAQTWMPATYEHSTGTSVFNSGALRKAIYGGFLEFDFPVEHMCGSGNCTWDPFVSLGVCSQCQDVAATTKQSCLPGAGVLNRNCTQIVHDLPSYNLSMTLQNGSAVGTTGTQRHSLTKGVTSPLYPYTRMSPIQFHFAIAQLLVDVDGTGRVTNLTSLQDPSWNITACTISWCAKVYEGIRVTNGTFNETLPEGVDLVPTTNGTCLNSTTETCQNFQAANKSRLPKASADTVFRLASGDSKFTIRNLLIFDYNLTSQANTAALNSLEADNVAATLFWNTNISDASFHVATTSTNFIRATDHTFQVQGTAWADETYVEVKWVWFALPAVLVLLAAVFLVAVIVMSRSRGGESEPLWKTSTLPLLVHGHGWTNRSGTSQSVASNIGAQGMKAHLKRNYRGEIMFAKAN